MFCVVEVIRTSNDEWHIIRTSTRHQLVHHIYRVIETFQSSNSFGLIINNYLVLHCIVKVFQNSTLRALVHQCTVSIPGSISSRAAPMAPSYYVTVVSKVFHVGALEDL